VAAESRTAVFAALAGNAALAVLKGVAAAVSGSAGMLAETFHSLADTGNQLLLILGMRMARRPPDVVHPFGHGKNVYFWAFVVSVMLFTLGGAVSIWEAVHKLMKPGEAPGEHAWAYGVLASGFVFETASLAVALRALRRARGGQTLREFLRESRDPSLLTVVLEDSAALVSLALATAGLGLSQATGAPGWDAAASAAIGLVLVGVAVVLAFENHSLLLGESAPADVLTAVRRVVSEDPAVEALVRLDTMHLGPESLLVALGVRFRRSLRADEVDAAAARLRRRVREAVGRATTEQMILVEPTPERPRPTRRRAA
jgi:cation diffusion facilitator family transporter